MKYNFNENIFLNTLGLLLIATLSGFIRSGTISCGMQKIIRSSIFIKNLLTYLIILIAMLISAEEMSFVSILINSILLFIFFVLLQKSNVYFLIACIILIIIGIITQKIIEEQKNKFDRDDEKYKSLKKTQKYMSVIILIITGVFTVIGMCLYLKKQMNDHGDKFNFMTFFLGNNHCSEIKTNLMVADDD